MPTPRRCSRFALRSGGPSQTRAALAWEGAVNVAVAETVAVAVAETETETETENVAAWWGRLARVFDCASVLGWF